MIEPVLLEVLADSPTLVGVFFVARWLSSRIDRVLDLHERMIERLLDLSESEQRQREANGKL